MSLDPVALIDTNALSHNLKRATELSGGSKLMAVIKADGYGHGLVRVAKALGEADALAVARVSEAVELRTHGVDRPLVVLEGFLDAEELQLASRHRFILTLHAMHQLDLLDQQELPVPVRVWIKVDTGMNRLGFRPDQFNDVLARLRACQNVENEPGVMTHLACADEPDSETTPWQLSQFHTLAAESSLATSIANSAGIIGWPQSHANWSRPGLMLYGANPFGSHAADLGLQPAMTFSAKLIAIKELNVGDAVGYGSTWRSSVATHIGVVGVGYGDGYPREVKPGTSVLVNDQRVPIVGRVSMDMLTIDLQDLPHVSVGDSVTLWGRGLPIEEIAEAAGTIPYTLMCGVSPRVTRIEASA
ncbi:MAG: alanine racemase [bacterium]